jgi:hypothetical protein
MRPMIRTELLPLLLPCLWGIRNTIGHTYTCVAKHYTIIEFHVTQVLISKRPMYYVGETLIDLATGHEAHDSHRVTSLTSPLPMGGPLTVALWYILLLK